MLNCMVKPLGYWNDKNNCIAAAVQCKSIKEFELKFGGAYASSRRNNWIIEIFPHNSKKPNSYWTKEMCHKMALKCKSRSEFKKKYGSARNKAIKNGWIEEICSHMAYLREYNHTKEDCRLEALKYRTRKEFKENNSKMYHMITEHRWYDLFDHMPIVRNSNNYLSKIECYEEALKYATRIEFSKNSYRHYKVAYRKKWLDEICFHMKPLGNLYKRCVYVYEFSDKSVYIGLTFNLEKRDNQHLNKKTPVHNHMEKTHTHPIRRILSEYIDAIEAKQLEINTIIEYRNNGWNILNKSKGGELGGNPKNFSK